MAESKHSSSRAKSSMGSKSKSGKKSGKKPHSIHVRRGKSGGFIAEHHFKNDSTDPSDMAPEPEEHVLPDMNSLQSHMAENMGDQEPAQAPSPDMSQAGPAPGPGGPAPQAGPAPQMGA